MTTQRPSILAILGVGAFTTACVGLLLYLWISFGGSVPFAAEGYRFSVEFTQAAELAPDAQVDIAGVSVGHVVSVELDHRTGLSRAVLEINRKFAPRPADTKAILRAKTLLGETFVELSPGIPSGPKLHDGASLPQAQVSPTVSLDQIFSTFDPTTRQAFQTWMQQSAIALTNRGEQFNAALADLYPFATNVDAVLAVLHREGQATSTLLRDSGQVFSALSASPTQVQSFVRNSNAVFAATAARDTDLAQTFKALPAFLAQTRFTISRVTRFSQTTEPLVNELRPAALALNPALAKLVTLAPELRQLMVQIRPLTQASVKGLPALERFLDESVPFLTRLKPYLGGVVPVINYINDYRREIAAFFANSTATTQGTEQAGAGSGLLHYLRISSPINPELLTTYQTRPESNRSNPYLQPSGYDQLSKGLPVFGNYLCTSHPLPGLSPSLSDSTTSVGPEVLTVAQVLQKYYFTSNPSGPTCKGQRSLGALTTGSDQTFPHLHALP